MAAKTTFTEQDDKQIKDYILNHPYNIAKACRDLAGKLNRTPQAISNRWYKKLSKTDKCFTLYGKNSHTLNRKNTKTVIPHKVSIFNKIMNLIFPK